ncbi:nucleolar protein dao-5 isoform X1 [Drosophila nasuta]|uniref:nucleolar protein dao-5 isoform X1 n=1 Tax=Drosophila nasuta TaxID=42062 RepID=UPI00295E4E92|nr:nucleolar protein dao-5 isoform X1 [Drosophila nasuta]
MAETADDNKLKEKLGATPPLPQPKTEETNSVAAEEERGEQEEAEAEKAGPVKSKHEDIKIPEDDKIDKLDELSSLEQEIAKMHNLQHDDDTETETDQLAKELAEQVKDAGDSAATENGNASNEAQLTDELVSRRPTPVNHNKDETASAATLKDVDLIALLKGTDQEQEQPTAAAAPAADQKSIELALAELDNVGVTIEGEGQYEIMEIDDGDNGSTASPVVLHAAVAAAAPKSAAKGKAKLSPEQARAVALEQMADLKAQTARRKEAAAKQQQQQQQQQPQQQPMDIVSSLNDDWNEYDSGSDNNSNSHSNANSNLTAASKRPIAKKASKVSSESVGNAKALTKSPTQSALDKLKAATTVEPTNNNNSPEATGYKRTRVIKRKIIWDPDMPDAQKSLAQYATTKAGGSNSASPTATATVTSERPTTPRASGQESMKRARPMTPKDVHKVAAKRVATPAKLNESNVASTTTANRRAQTPNGAASGSVVQVKKKKVSEIDRLMGDEGAANMMQAVEREQRELSGGESPNKPLMRKRSLTITGRQQQQQPQKANSSELMSPTTPKKESPPKAYKRASTPAAAIDAVFKNNKAATPKPQPSDSWDYVYKQRASEESMIMRRRSNSSYSSNASASRLSLDNRPAAVANLSDDASDAPANDPAFKFLKPETKTNQRNDGSPPQTLANDLKQQQLPKESKASAKTELITLHKLEKVSQLIVNMQPSKTGYTYKLQLLQKLTEMLNKLAKSNDCNTVLLSVGQGQTFCQGIDCQELIASALDKRKSGANQLGLVLKTYLRTLLTFPKPLVAGVVGNLKNLGVMQLPLFDYVVSADDCSLETSYAKLGQLPEGYALWHNHPKVSSQVHNRLFLLGEQLQALELVTTVGGNSFIDKCCKARSVNDEALEVAKLISNSTAEHYRGLKKLNQTANAALLPSLDAEFKILTEQWASAQFQANCKRYVSDLNI